MLPFGHLFANLGATWVASQVGNAGDPLLPLAQQGAQAGDYGIWINEGGSPPSSGWTSLGGSGAAIYGKVLAASDLNIASNPTHPWGIAVYRDVRSAVAVSAAGFAKSAQHMGVIAVNYQGGIALTSPDNMYLRINAANTPAFRLFDRVLPNGPYADGTPFMPNTNLLVFELRN